MRVSTEEKIQEKLKFGRRQNFWHYDLDRAIQSLVFLDIQ